MGVPSGLMPNTLMRKILQWLSCRLLREISTSAASWAAAEARAVACTAWAWTKANAPPTGGTGSIKWSSWAWSRPDKVRRCMSGTLGSSSHLAQIFIYGQNRLPERVFVGSWQIGNENYVGVESRHKLCHCQSTTRAFMTGVGVQWAAFQSGPRPFKEWPYRVGCEPLWRARTFNE